MAKSKKREPRASRTSKANKALEALRKTQEINDIVARGGVEAQALLYSGVESRPEEETHISALLETPAGSGTTQSRREKRKRR